MINKVLAIAIDDYEDDDLNKLHNCKSDVEAIIGILEDKYSFDPIEFIYKKEFTTRSQLYLKLTEYFSNALIDENILLIFAGHGQYNSKTKRAYWQPSDATNNDASGWINISELLDFIGTSEAHHINIISDSCFSGVIFKKESRGGGVNALSSKRSREALTSGGIEKVSDGIKGENSDFTKSIIKILLENENMDLLFNDFSQRVILDFGSEKQQTPEMGSLSGVGHEGGSFVFKLKQKKLSDSINDANTYLKKKMANLYIPLEQTSIGYIEILKETKKEKNESVKNQRFEEAANLRDQEKEIEMKIREDFQMCINVINLETQFSANEIAMSENLDSDIEIYNKSMADEKEALVKRKIKLKKIVNKLIDFESINLTPTLLIDDRPLPKFVPPIYNWDNPATKYFSNNQNKFFDLYNIDIISLYKNFKQKQCNSTSIILGEKENQLIEIIFKILDLERDFLIWKGDDLNELISKKEIEINVLKWINN